MGKHLEYLAEFKTLLETKKVSNNGILVLDKYSERMSVRYSHKYTVLQLYVFPLIFISVFPKYVFISTPKDAKLSQFAQYYVFVDFNLV